jgi:uncharacterized protein with HEPN domain
MTKQPEPLIGAAYDALSIVVDRISQKSKQVFLDNPVLQDATLMRLLEAGEYLARVRDSYGEYYDEHHNDAWNNLIGLRNIIAHGYLQVDRDKVWDIVQNEVPALITELQSLI